MNNTQKNHAMSRIFSIISEKISEAVAIDTEAANSPEFNLTLGDVAEQVKSGKLPLKKLPLNTVLHASNSLHTLLDLDKAFKLTKKPSFHSTSEPVDLVLKDPTTQRSYRRWTVRSPALAARIKKCIAAFTVHCDAIMLGNDKSALQAIERAGQIKV